MFRAGRKTTTLCAAFAALCILQSRSGAAAGAEGKPGAPYASCMAKASSTSSMQACQAAGLKDANARLAVAYAKALGALPADQQAKLRDAQQRWSAFRSSDCRVFYGKQTGTLANIEGGGCMIERAEDRIKNLRGFLPQSQ
jgi:uncharacterized protein YecT (DUF1311 family)